MSTKGLKTKRPRQGSALWVLLLLVLVIAGLFAWTRVSESDSQSGMTQDATAGPNLGEPTPTADLAPLPEDTLTPSSRVEVGPLPYRRMRKVFDGHGQISGELFPNEMAPMPEAWTLVIEPSEFALGRKSATRRELELSGKQTTFEVRDLPMGSYRVYARAEGQASVPMEISLFKIEGPGHQVKDHSHVMLRLEPLSSLQITLQNEDFSPALDLPLVLEAKNTRKRWLGKTDAAGLFTFENLPTGVFTLFVGFTDQPLVPPATIQVDRDKQISWEGTLPTTHQITLRVIDKNAQPLPGAIVRGHGGAPIDEVTDFMGEVTLRYLPKGTYRLRVEHTATERNGRTTFVIPAPEGQPNPLPVYCRK